MQVSSISAQIVFCIASSNQRTTVSCIESRVQNSTVFTTVPHGQNTIGTVLHIRKVQYSVMCSLFRILEYPLLLFENFSVLYVLENDSIFVSECFLDGSWTPPHLKCYCALRREYYSILLENYSILYCLASYSILYCLANTLSCTV